MTTSTVGGTSQRLRVRRLELRNFRSFKELSVELGRFNVLVGPNAAGKSNLVEGLRFLRDISRHGLVNAVSMQGGIEYLRNVGIGASEPLTLTVEIEGAVYYPTIASSPQLDGYYEIESDSLTYTFSLEFPKKRGAFRIARDEMVLNSRLVETTWESKPTGIEIPGVITLTKRGGEIARVVDFPDAPPIETDEQRLFLPVFVDRREPERSLLLESFYPTIASTGGGRVLNDLAIYDFDPKLPKRAVPITGRRELEEDGSNLAIVLESILERPEGRQRFTQLVRDLLPFAERFRVDRIADRSVLFSLRDVYGGRFHYPASFMSDGTINVIALVAAAFFAPAPVAVIEEPERNLHPALISRVVALLRDASSHKQLLLTTHHPEVLRHLELDELLLARRDGEGFTVISLAEASESVHTFLEHDIGLDELFVQNLLSVGE